MISAGEVAIAAQLERLEAIIKPVQESLRTLALPPRLNAQLKKLYDNFAALSGAADKAAAGSTAAFDRIDASIGGTQKMAADLSAELARVAAQATEMTTASAAAAKAIAVPSLSAESRIGAPGGPKGPSASGAGGVHFGALGTPMPGGAHMSVSGGPALVASAAVGYGAYEEAKVEDFVNRIFLTGGISTGNQLANPLFGKIRDTIMKAYVMTGLPLEQIEEGILTGTRGLAGIDLQKRLALMPQLLAAAATEAYLKEGTTVPEAMQAFVGLAHMEGKYDPAAIGKLADHFAYLSTTTPVTVKQIESAASYAIPMLRTADFDPEQVLLMITSMERAGITNTKAGTWISQLATQSFPGTSLMSKMLFKKHEAALHALGLIDKYEKPTWFTDGRPDLVKMTEIAGDAISKMDAPHRLAVEKALWGQQGGRAAGFFADPTNRAIMGAVADEEKNFISGEAMWKQSLENSPIVQFRTAFAGLNVELINLGSNVLPYVTGMLKKTNELLGGKGELAVAGGGLAAWMLRKPIGNLIKGGVAGIGDFLGNVAGDLGLGAADIFPPVAAAAAGGAALGYLHQFAVPRTASDWPDAGQFERARRAQDAFRRDPEAAHARALGGMVSPGQIVNNIHLTAYFDGQQIVGKLTAEVESRLLGDGFTHGPSSFDSHANYASPDHAIGIGAN